MNGIPKNEKVWVTTKTDNGDVYYTTAKQNDRSWYFLYKVIDGKAVRLGKNRNPKELEEKFIMS